LPEHAGDPAPARFNFRKIAHRLATASTGAGKDPRGTASRVDLTSRIRAGNVASAFNRADLMFSLRARYKSG
jgi:hypothetical protein